MPGGMCEQHMMLHCPLCNKSDAADPRVTALAPALPAPGTVPTPVHLVDKPPEPPKPELTDPKAKLALELAQAYEEVGSLEKLFNATKTALTEAIAKRDRLLTELFPKTIAVLSKDTNA